MFFGSGSGRGLVHNNKTGKETFMRMLQGGVGLGVGVEDARMVFVFSTREAMESFIRDGWVVGGDANAAAKGGDAGAATSGALEVAPGISVYRLVQNGLSLDAMVKGTKYWEDKEMNSGTK
jgi:lipid-binding SYLF domain-containing protein